VCIPSGHELRHVPTPARCRQLPTPAPTQTPQATAFGAVLDVLIDNGIRGWLWCTALPEGAGAAALLLEMTAFAFTHAVSGAEWKSAFFAGAPGWVKAVMANGFRQPAGAAAVAGLMGCPLWLFAVR